MRASLKLLLLVPLVACAARQHDDAMSAAEHRHIAERERAAADAYATAGPAWAPSSPPLGGRPGGGPVNPAGPWALSDRHAGVHVSDFLSHAAEHEAIADALERFEAKECAGVAPPVRAACPLIPVISVADLPDGVRLRVSADRLDEVLAAMRCHLAFARAQGRLRAPDCPLYIPGVDIVRAPDGSGIDLVARSPDVAREIRRRAHEHL